MKSTITLTDWPAAISIGSDGSFLAPLIHGLPLISVGHDGPFVNPLIEGISLWPFPRAGDSEVQECHTRCSYRQACRQVLGEVFLRQGRWQREDISAYDRISIAQRFYDPERSWGTITRMAEECDLSRQSIYDIAGRARSLFDPRPPGPTPCVGQLLPCHNEVWTGFQGGISQDPAVHDPHRLILTALFPGGVPLRPMQELLEEAQKHRPGLGTLWNIVDQEGAKALHILSQVDYAGMTQDAILVSMDETFFDGRPFLLVVEPISLAICGFYVPPDGDRSSDTWEPLLFCLQQDQHLSFYGSVGDAARPYPKSIQTVLEQARRFQEDIFHTRRELETLRRKLENSAYRAFTAEYRARRQWEKESTPEAQEALRQAQAESLRRATLHDTFEELCRWVADATEMIDLRSGEVRDRETNLWLLNEAIAQMSTLDHPEVVKMARRLKNHQDRLLTYLDWLEERLAPLLASLHDYLDDPELEKAVLRAVAREWRLKHELESLGRRAFRQAHQQAEQEANLWIEGDEFLMPWRERVLGVLEWVQRASSAVECINSILKPLLARKKHFASAETAYRFLALFVLWHNLRVFREGKRKGRSPFEILGIDLGEKDWRTLLGYPPAQ